MKFIQNTLWWLAGTDRKTIENCQPRDQMARTALGVVFLLNYAALLIAWVNVGERYYGDMGIFPGLLIPSVFLSLDRIIAMRHRNLTGVLAVYNIGQADDKSDIKLRIAMAISLSLATTFTLQMDQANAEIRDKSHAEWQAANANLRDEIVGQITAEYAEKQKAAQEQETILKDKYTLAKQALEKAIAIEDETSSKAREARDEQYAQDGGVGSRRIGQGSEYWAQFAIAEHNKALANEAKMSKKSAETRLNKLDEQLKIISKDRIKTESDKTKFLTKVDTVMRADSRFVSEKIGLFSDATLFVGLFFDSKVAAGMWVMSLVIWGVLLALELAALIALKLLPTTAYDVHLIADLRVEAAKIVTEAEIKLMQHAAQTPPIHVNPLDAAQRNQHRNEEA